MASRLNNRIFFMGLTNDGKIISHVTGPDNNISNELKKFEEENLKSLLRLFLIFQNWIIQSLNY